MKKPQGYDNILPDKFLHMRHAESLLNSLSLSSLAPDPTPGAEMSIPPYKQKSSILPYSWRKPFILISLIVLLCIAGIYRSPVVDELFTELRYGSFSELKNKIHFFSYFTTHVSKLSIDSSGYYTLSPSNSHQQENLFEEAVIEYHLGSYKNALSLFEQSIQQNGETADLLLWLFMTHLRIAELQNFESSFSENSIKAGYSYSSPENKKKRNNASSRLRHLEQAKKYISRLLTTENSENGLYRWLLHYTEFLSYSPSEESKKNYPLTTVFFNALLSLKSPADQKQLPNIQFEEQAQKYGLDLLDAGKGVAVEDFNRDGFLDLVTGSSYGPIRYFQNHSGEFFSERTQQSGLAQSLQPYAISAADYNNDRYPDIFVTRPFHHYQLFENLKNGRFKDVTYSSGLLKKTSEQRFHGTWHAAWGDVDRDGDLDIFLSQWGQKIPGAKGVFLKKPENSKLFINMNGKFVDGTELFQLDKIVNNKNYVAAAFGDVNDDGYPELFLSSFSRTKSILLMNIQGKSYRKSNLIYRPEAGFMTAFLDLNHDGLLDLYQSGNGPAQTVIGNTIQGKNTDRYRNNIFLQQQNGSFVQSFKSFDEISVTTLGVSYGDVNNDGCFDFSLGTGNPEPWFIMPNLFYLGTPNSSRCSEAMHNISTRKELRSFEKGQATVFFDIDNDGDQDFYNVHGGMWPGDRWRNRLYINKGNTHHQWLKIRLYGRETNSFGVGAKIKAVAENHNKEKIIRYYHMDNKTGFGSTPYIAHIGLLDAQTLNYIEVLWPVSGKIKRYRARLGEINILDEHQGEVVDVL